MVSGQKIWSNVVSDDNNDYKVTTLWKTITISFQGGEIASDIITSCIKSVQMLVNHFLYDIFFDEECPIGYPNHHMTFKLA